MAKANSRKSGKGRRSAYAAAGGFTSLIPFIIISYYAFGQHDKGSAEIQLVLIVFRHGDRTPTTFYPNDPYRDPQFWPEGLGALTKEGKQEMYKLGEFLRERYRRFLPDVYSPDDIYVMSSDHDRCLMSAQLCLAALYPPVGEQIWNKNLAWQPIPVHTVPRKLDQLIVVKKPCPKYEAELNRTYHAGYFSKINNDNAELYKFLTEHSGTEVENVLQLESLYNTLEVEGKRNLKLPDWTEKVDKDRMKRLSALSLAAFTFTETAKRLKGGPILGEVVEHISKKILGLLKPDRLMYLYSGHDLTLVSVLRALGFQELFKPDSGAVLIFELHRPADEGEHSVQLLYLNNTRVSEPLRLTIPGCEENCKLKDFLRITKPLLYLNNTRVSEPLRLTIPGCEENCKLKDFLRITKPVIPVDWDQGCHSRVDLM